MPAGVLRQTKARGAKRAKRSAAARLAPEEIALNNAVGAAAALDLAARRAAAEAEDAALVNAVARAAARSLAS